jgi:hypothetical protein
MRLNLNLVAKILAIISHLTFESGLAGRIIIAVIIILGFLLL